MKIKRYEMKQGSIKTRLSEHKKLMKSLRKQIEFCLSHYGTRAIVFVPNRPKQQVIASNIKEICNDQKIRRRITAIRETKDQCTVYFDNNGYISVCPLRDNVRGIRAHCCLIDGEIEKEMVDVLVKPMIRPFCIEYPKIIKKITGKSFRYKYPKNAVRVLKM